MKDQSTAISSIYVSETLFSFVLHFIVTQCSRKVNFTHSALEAFWLSRFCIHCKVLRLIAPSCTSYRAFYHSKGSMLDKEPCSLACASLISLLNSQYLESFKCKSVIIRVVRFTLPQNERRVSLERIIFFFWTIMHAFSILMPRFLEFGLIITIYALHPFHYNSYSSLLLPLARHQSLQAFPHNIFLYSQRRTLVRQTSFTAFLATLQKAGGRL